MQKSPISRFIDLQRSFPLQLYASSLTFYTLLALVPVLAFWLWLLENLHIDDLFHIIMHGFLDPMGAIGETVGSTLFDFVHNTHQGVLHHFTLLLFFISIFILIGKIDAALNALWSCSTNLDKKYLCNWSLIFLFIIAASFLLFLIKLGGDWYISVKQSGAYLFSALMLIGLFKWIPRTQVRLAAAMAGASFCLILWFPLSRLFHALLLLNQTYVVVYRDFVGAIIMLIWINSLWWLFLSGALISRTVQQLRIDKH